MSRLGRAQPAGAYLLVRPVNAPAPVSAAQGDEAGAADSLAASAAVPQADAAGAADSLAVNVPVVPGDAAGAVESVAISTPAALPQAAGAADSLAVSVTLPMGDAAGAKDGAANTTPALAEAAGAADSLAASAAVPQADAAGAADSLAAPAAVPQANTAGGAESVTIAVTAPLAEAAGVADKLTAGVAAPQADTAGAADALGYVVGVAPRDAAGVTDSLSVQASVPLPDKAAGLDSTGVVGGGTGPVGFGSTLPYSVISQYNPPGYPGGPAGHQSVVPSALGNGWEINVVSGQDYQTLLAVIPASMLLNVQFVRQLSDTGSGTVALSLDDPWWSRVTLPGGLAAETLLDEECLWQVWKDGVYRFDFLGETVTEQLTDPSEQRQVTVTGPGTIATLKWAMIAPQGFPDIVLKLDGLLDSFDEVDVNGNPVLDTNIWTTASPASHIYITPIANLYTYPGGVGYNLGTLMPSGSLTLLASASGTLLGSSPWDATDTLISAQVTPVGASAAATDAGNPQPYGSGLNGSELTQMFFTSNRRGNCYAMIALSSNAFYAQYSGPEGNFTALLPPYDSQQHAYWMITEQAGSGGGPGTFYWWTSPDGQNWTLQWQRVHSWDATNVSFYIWAYYSVDSAESAVITNLNSNVTTPSYQGSIYLGEPLMGVWLDQFSAAQGRGTVPFVTTRATASADSFGRPWSDTQNVQATNGTDLYSFLQSAAAVVNADYVMNPGFQLVVGQPTTSGVGIGVDRSGYLVLRDGYDVMARQRVRARNQITTLLGGENADGHEISASSPAYIAEWGQRETWFQAAVQVDPTSMAYASAAALAQNETEIVSWTFTLTPNLPGKTVFDNFDVGDWVGLERPDFSGVDKVRVVGIAVQVDASGNETHELTFQSYIQWLAEQLTYLANKLGGQFVNAQGTSPVAPSKYGTGQVPTYFTPAATLKTLADVSGLSSGSTMSNAPLVYNPATGNYQHAGTTDPVTGQMIPVTVQTPSGSATLTDTTVVVNTGNGTTVIGLQGDGTVTTVDGGGTAPATPDAPAVTAVTQGLQATWDGLLAGAAPLSNFQYVQVHVGATSGFVPSSATLVDTLQTAGTVTLTGLTVSAVYYVKLVAVSTSGLSSVPTSAVGVTVIGLPTSVLTGQLPASLLGPSAGAQALNPNPFFNGGDLTGWTVVNGSLAATGTVPAGAPGHPQFVAQVASTAANCLISGSSAPFTTVPGEPYAMTAWVYNPGGSAVTVAAGFNWASGTSTVSCAAGAWTPVTVVKTCPVGVTSAYQVIGPVASGVTVNISGAVAAGQIPGLLLAADSVTANQIAANTITAGQIAANTITASQIAANTITAGQIAASTITAAQIAAGTITAAKLSAGIVVAGIVDATTITGATFVATGTAGEYLAYSGTPASGNLIMSISASATTDVYGNAVLKGLVIGSPSGSTPQVALVPAAGGPATAAQLQFPLYPSSFFLSLPNIAGASPGSSGILFVSGAALAQAGFQDSVQDRYYTYAGTTTATHYFSYIDNSHVTWDMMTLSTEGVTVKVCNAIYGLHPGTGTLNTNPGVAESWQTATLINGWSGSGGAVNGIRYRMIPLGAGMIEIEGDIINVTATGNSVAAVMATGYNCPVPRNWPAGWNNPVASNSASVPWVTVFPSGQIQITGIQVANKGIFFHVLIPMD